MDFIQRSTYFLSFLVKILINFANRSVTSFECVIAYFLQQAFPNIVIPAIKADTRDDTNIAVKSPEIAILPKMLAPAAPDRIPHISPMTSVHIALILSALLMRDIACLLPVTFLDAIARNGSIELEVTATPNISNTMLMSIKTSTTIIDTINTAFDRASSLRILNEKDRNMARNNTFTGHTHPLCFLSFLFFSCFSSSFSIIYIMLIACRFQSTKATF